MTQTKMLTDSMWFLLRYAEKMHPFEADIGGSGVMRVARKLEQRGLLSVTRQRKGGSIRLTEAGRETAARAPRG